MNGDKKNILILEDNEYYMNFAYEILSEVREVNIYKAYDSATAYKYAMEITIDVFIVDIILDSSSKGDVSGINFVDRIRMIHKYKFTPIIITSSLEDPKFHTYSLLHCYRYFEKSYDRDELLHTIKEALLFENTKEIKKHIYYKRQGILFSLNISEIVYIKNCTRNIEYHCIDNVHTAPYKTIKNILLELEGCGFVQCSKHTVVNKNYIASVDPVNRYIMLAGNYGTLEIGSRIKKDFMSRLTND